MSDIVEYEYENLIFNLICKSNKTSKSDVSEWSKILLHFWKSHDDIQELKSVCPVLIFLAARYSDLPSLNLILEQCHSFFSNLNELSVNKRIELNYQDCFGETALHYATRRQHLYVVQLLTILGCDVNIRDMYHNTCLHIAAKNQNKEIIEVLLKAGADVNAKTRTFGETALHNVCGFYDPKCESLSRVDHFNKDIINLLIKYGADVEAFSGRGYTPLQEAAREGRYKVIKFLLNVGANVNFKDNANNTALYYAISNKNLKIVEYLLRKGIEVNSVNLYGLTPLLHLTSCNTHPFRKDIKLKMVELLVDYGADINARDELVGTVLFSALVTNQMEIVEYLLSINADIIDRGYSNYSIPLCFIQECIGNGTFDPVRKVFYKMESEYMFQMLMAHAAMKEKDFSKHTLINVDPQILDYVISIFGECKLELKMMKNTSICNRRLLTFYSLLTEDIYKIVRVTADYNVLRDLENEEYMRKFPLFGYLLKKRIDRIMSLRIPVSNTIVFLINKWKRLPLPVIENVCSYLQPQDFRNFQKAIFMKSSTVINNNIPIVNRFNFTTLGTNQTEILEKLKQVGNSENEWKNSMPYCQHYRGSIYNNCILKVNSLWMVG